MIDVISQLYIKLIKSDSKYIMLQQFSISDESRTFELPIYQKILDSNIDNNKKVSWTPNQHIRVDTKYWSNGCWKLLFWRLRKALQVFWVD